MKKDAYIIWNWKENRPAVMQGQFSPMLIFHDLDHAQAKESSQHKIDKTRNHEIRKVQLIVDDKPI